MKAKSINANSVAGVRQALQQYMADGFSPTLGVTFLSIKQDRAAISELFDELNIDIIGATSCTEFTETDQTENGIAILLLEIDRTDYKILFEDIGERSLEDVASKLALDALNAFSQPAFIICSTSITAEGGMLDGETLVRGIERIAGSQVSMFGGMAGDDMSFKGTYVFTRKFSTGYGVTALILNEQNIGMYGVALSGWKAVGVSRTMTKCKKNLLYEIDGKPALETYLRYLGEDLVSTEDQTRFFDSVGLHYPFQIERQGRESMMCNPMGYNKVENALVLESDVETGTRFRFSTPPDFDIIETVLDKAREINKAAGITADAVMIFSCASRLSALGPMARQENEGLAGIWNSPMAGFYTYGEFGRAVNGKHEFHSTTCSWVALKEKN
jgi:hypothetical protein